MENNTLKTASQLGFYPVSSQVLEGRIQNIQQEIELLTSIVKDAKKNPFFRQLATQIINTFPCQHKNYDCYIFAIAKWIRENIKYIKDITGYETLQTPENTLKIGGGDCDDHAILVATLLNAIGIKTAFKIVGKNGRYRHIYVVATTPEGKKWAVDTTEENYFYPIKQDREYEMEILQELEGMQELGFGFKIKFKPKKFFKRATGGIRRPRKFIKRLKRKPLAFTNKTIRPLLPKPIKATTRALGPVIKPIRKIEKINPVKIKGFKPIKAVKRATASRSIDEAALKIGAAVVAGKVAAPYISKAASAAAAAAKSTLPTAQTVLETAQQGINTVSQTQTKQTSTSVIQSAAARPKTVIQKTENPEMEQLLKNPLVVASGILALGLILGGK